jgi:hypothetical protein
LYKVREIWTQLCWSSSVTLTKLLDQVVANVLVTLTEEYKGGLYVNLLRMRWTSIQLRPIPKGYFTLLSNRSKPLIHAHAGGVEVGW